MVCSKPQSTDTAGGYSKPRPIRCFLRKKESQQARINTPVSSGIPIVMRATVNLNPMLRAAVLLDPTTGNAIEASGEGELSVNFNSKSTPPVRLYGDFVINSGKFHYNLQNLRTIDFTIREGSRLTMEGDPMNTQFNITAYLPVRADLVALSPTFSSELANTRVPVNALLQVRGNLEAMDLRTTLSCRKFQRHYNSGEQFYQLMRRPRSCSLPILPHRQLIPQRFSRFKISVRRYLRDLPPIHWRGDWMRCLPSAFERQLGR